MSGNNRGRRNWTPTLTIATLVALAAAIFGCMAGEESQSTDRAYFQSSAGAVLFDHGKHGQTIGSCTPCHHDLYSAEPATSCKECHDDSVEADEFEHAELKEIHSRDCSKCHQDRGEKVQAVSCRECHPDTQESEKRTLSCTECHDDSFSADMMAHDEYMDAGEHTCKGCHAPRSVSESYHTNCTPCHLESAAERFAKDDGAVKCAACHLR
jgi:hypothetical protein